MICLSQARGGTLCLPGIPQRIVSLVPSITETLILFGKKPVGRTRFCIHPQDEIDSIPVVGGPKDPNLSLLLSLHPDLVIVSPEENRIEDVQKLLKQGLSVWVTEVQKISEVLPWLEGVEKMVGENDPSQKILTDLRRGLSSFPHSFSCLPRCLLLIWKNPWMGVTSQTYAGDMIRQAGGDPCLEEGEKYPRLTEEKILNLKLDFLFLSSEPFPFKPDEKENWEKKFQDQGQKVRVEMVSGEDVHWYGPRVLEGLQTFLKFFSKKAINSCP